MNQDDFGFSRIRCYAWSPMDQDEAIEEQIELRLHVSHDESDGLVAMRSSFRGIVTKKAAARLLILYGLEHIEAVLAWYGQSVVDAVRKTRSR